MTILVCEKCGNMVSLLKKGTCPVKCCGEPLVELTANTTDAAQEKHVPAVTIDGDKVNVKIGTVEHPMVDAGDEYVAAYDYCNLHGLWKA